MMRPRHSDIFEAYAKLAEEKGLVKTAAEDKKKKKDKESSELKGYRSDVYPRVGSDDISTIEALYGVKPKTSPGMDYDRNIIELAHPHTVVVAPAYDKLNALVENVNQRQNIIINKILSRPPSGTADMFLKDATTELTMQLVRIGNDMDNADEDELRLLADDCLEDLKKNAGLWDDISDFTHKAVNSIGGNKGEKTLNDVTSIGTGVAEGAAAGAVIGAIVTSWGGPLSLAGAGVGGLLGGLAGGVGAYIFNTGSKVSNIAINSKNLSKQLADLKTAVPEETEFFSLIENTLNKISAAASKYLAAINVIRTKDINGEVATPAETEEVAKDTKEFVALIETFDKVRDAFKKKTSEGAFAKALNSTPGLDNDIQDVDKEFDSLAVSIENLKSTMGKVVDKAIVDAKKPIPAEKPVAAPAAAPTATEPEKKEDSSFEKFWQMLGRKPDKDSMSFWNSLPENAH